MQAKEPESLQPSDDSPEGPPEPEPYDPAKHLQSGFMRPSYAQQQRPKLKTISSGVGWDKSQSFNAMPGSQKPGMAKGAQ